MATKTVEVENLVPGGILGEAVLTISGKVLLGKDIVVTRRIIDLLNSWDIKKVCLKDPAAEPQNVQYSANLDDQLSTNVGYINFFEDYDKVITSTAQCFEFIHKHKILPVKYFHDTSVSIYNAIMLAGPALTSYLLVGDYEVGDKLSRHSVMVSFISGLIARHMELSAETVLEVTMAGLLHDVGKLLLDKDNLARPYAHVGTGAALIKGVSGLSNDIILGILQHHECIDGSGHPTGVNGLKIHPYAKIIAVADTFHTQAYSGEYANPFPVLELLAQEMFGRLDPTVCHTFISRVKDCLLRTKVLLNDGREAEVIYFHPTGSCQPIVKTDDEAIIDLSAFPNLKVNRISLANDFAAGF